jgi:hypothetical protein
LLILADPAGVALKNPEPANEPIAMAFEPCPVCPAL